MQVPHPSRSHLALAALAVLGLASVVPVVRAQRPDPDTVLVDRYCVGCHGPARQMGGVNLSRLAPARSGRDTALWERVLGQLRTGVMPPPGSARPDGASATRFIAAAERALDAAAAVAPQPGRPVAHRLNRTEYANAVRDVLALDLDVEALLPQDETLEGFDNIGGVLTTSPALIDRYLSAARRISRLAVGDPAITPAFAAQTYRAEQAAFQDARTLEDVPFGARGGLAVRHHFPMDATYAIRVSLQRNVLSYVRGLTEPRAVDIRLDGALLRRVVVAPPKDAVPAPLSFTGVILGDPRWEAWAVTADEGLEVRFPATAGPHVVSASFVHEAYETEGVRQPPLTGLGLAYSEFASAPTGPWGPAVDSLTVDGPFSATGPGTTPSRTRIFVCTPAAPADEVSCARRIFSSLVRRAYRRPALSTDVDRLMPFFTRGRAGGGTFDAGVQAALERLLVDPSFLFRVERDPAGVAAGAAYPVADLALASRLSFFLWSSVPDDALLDAAAAGRLHEPATLMRETRRLLADSRADRLASVFAMQWLELRQLRPATLDEEILPEYDGSLRAAFLRETELFVADQVRRDRPVVELLTARESFLNERLARHYGIRGVYGGHFRRVAVGEERAGLLGQGSILTSTSYPTRTSPVLRGRWLLENVFGTPPPPPPPTIPPLPPATLDNRTLSMRQRTERHRTNPACAGCHVRMDPLGFALEEFDAIGRWRSTGDDGAPVDTTGALPDGTQFSGVAGLRGLVTAHPETFVRTLTAKLMTFALGRRLEPADEAAVRQVVRDAAAGEYRWSALIEGIVRSVPFRMRTAS